MIALYIYLSGFAVVWCIFLYCVFIEKAEVRKKDVLAFFMLSICSYLSLVFFVAMVMDEYMSEHGDEVVFNRKKEDDDEEIL